MSSFVLGSLHLAVVCKTVLALSSEITMLRGERGVLLLNRIVFRWALSEVIVPIRGQTSWPRSDMSWCS